MEPIKADLRVTYQRGFSIREGRRKSILPAIQSSAAQLKNQKICIEMKKEFNEMKKESKKPIIFTGMKLTISRKDLDYTEF